MAITAAQPGWNAVFWFRFDNREEYTTEPVIGWSTKHNGEIEPVSMVAAGKYKLPTPTAADQRRSAEATAERYLGCIEDGAAWPFDSDDPRQKEPDPQGTRRVVVERKVSSGVGSFELEE